jgi:hypothetical protein
VDRREQLPLGSAQHRAPRRAYGLHMMQAARFFAMTFTAQADTFQVGMSAKYYYVFWRPFTAIPDADIDA